MDNQHKHIKGYRDLTKEEIDLMNRIKAKGAELLALHAELVGHLKSAGDEKFAKAAATPAGSLERVEHERFQGAEPFRWAAIGKTDIQTGVMALVRAVAQPAGI